MSSPLKSIGMSQAQVLTPRRPRKIRPSFSPVKSPPVASPLKKSKSLENIPTEATSLKPLSILPTSALEFEEFSFEKDGEVSYGNATKEQRVALNKYLQEHYTGKVTFDIAPFLFIDCEQLPPEDKRPFLIAGMIAVWRDKAKDEGGIADLQVYMAYGERFTLPDEIEAMFDGYNTPPEDVLIYLASVVFPDCIAMSFILETLIVEMPEVSEEEFGVQLDQLPTLVIGIPFHLQYHNGPLPRTERVKRAIKPEPKRIDGDCDTTCYMKTNGKFNPGAMIASVNEKDGTTDMATAGVLVQRGQQRRLTCSYHLWAKQTQIHESLVGKTTPEAQNAFRLLQGEPGTPVGFLRERIGVTDIALAQLNSGIRFENIFLDSDTNPKTFIPSTQQQNRDRYVINSFTTGEQMLLHIGDRVRFGERLSRGGHSTLRVPVGMEHLWPKDGVAYIPLRQGIFATNEPILTRKPYIRAGVCGAVLVRVFDQARYKQGIKESEQEVRSRGEICGMMHFADLQAKFGAGGLGDFMIFADAFDPLIDGGWKIVPAPDIEAETSGAPEATEEEAEDEESPKKKQKIGGRGKGKGKGKEKQEESEEEELPSRMSRSHTASSKGEGKGKEKDAGLESPSKRKR